MREIALSRGMVALVDDEEYESLSIHRWHATRGASTFYAARNVRSPHGSRTVLMHRSILCASAPGLEVDHANGDGLDNRRENLRLATRSQNNHNRTAYKTNKYGLKGVSWHRKTQRWRAQIGIGGLRKHIGYYSSPAEAHVAYCAAAKELHGEFARTQ